MLNPLNVMERVLRAEYYLGTFAFKLAAVRAYVEAFFLVAHLRKDSLGLMCERLLDRLVFPWECIWVEGLMGEEVT